MDDIEHELAQLGADLGEAAKALRVREAEIIVHDPDLAAKLSDFVPKLEKMGNDLRVLASRWHAIT